MDNENNEVKTEEEIRAEVKAELEKEMEIKENAKKELLAEQQQEEMREYKKNKKKKSIFNIITHVIVYALILFVLFETVMGILDMQRINEDKDPIWYISTKVETKDNIEETTYNLGLYVIVKTKSPTENKTMLKPFFLK